MVPWRQGSRSSDKPLAFGSGASRIVKNLVGIGILCGAVKVMVTLLFRDSYTISPMKLESVTYRFAGPAQPSETELDQAVMELRLLREQMS